MDPVTRAVLLSWGWRWDVILILFTLGLLYAVGWWRLRQKTRLKRNERNKIKRNGLATYWRLFSYLTGLLIIGVALLSPIDVLGRQLFFMHMVQHLLLIMIAPPLLLIANPMPFLLWGLPEKWRLQTGRWIGQLLHRESSFRYWIRLGTSAGIVWIIWVAAVILWHDPYLYNAALQSELVHDLEHLSFFLASMLFWWLVTGAGPRIHRQFGAFGRIAFVLAAVPPNMALGIVLAFSSVVIYSYYEAVPTIWGIDPLTDQIIGGVIMWIPGSMMFFIAALILTARFVQGEADKPPLTMDEWSTDESMAAPGAKK